MDPISLTPVQALAVALSGVFSDTEMGECQEMAINIVENLNNLGYYIINNRFTMNNLGFAINNKA